MAQLILLPGKERSAFKHHPWLFAGSVGRLEGRARPGDTVEVLADNLRPLGRAAYSPQSQIRARHSYRSATATFGTITAHRR